MDKNIDRDEIATTELEDIIFEHINVFDRENDEERKNLVSYYGYIAIIKTNEKRRTNHEIYSAMKFINDELNIIIDDVKIINLPFTIKNKNGIEAKTAFTDRNIETRHIYLVPDDTNCRIKLEKEVHITQLQRLFNDGIIDELTYGKWKKSIVELDVQQRVACSILHEYGHILTYNIMDENKICNPGELFDFMDSYGYIDNASKRIPNMTTMYPQVILNTVLELLAEDYRVSHFVKCTGDTCCLPVNVSYIQDIINPNLLKEGIDIMEKILNISSAKQVSNKSIERPVDRILPFGEGDRTSDRYKELTTGNIKVITKEEKENMRAYFAKMSL